MREYNRLGSAGRDGTQSRDRNSPFGMDRQGGRNPPIQLQDNPSRLHLVPSANSQAPHEFHDQETPHGDNGWGQTSRQGYQQDDYHQSGAYQQQAYNTGGDAHFDTDGYFNYPQSNYPESRAGYETPQGYTPQPYGSNTPAYDPAYPAPNPNAMPMVQINGQLVPANYAPPAPSPAPAPIKRWKTVKEVQLYKGNLVLDCPVPPLLLNKVPHAQPPERDEFSHCRYTACTSTPDRFFDERFTLRQRLFAKPRDTELFIVVTMYNEEDFLFARTMKGVFQNISYMCQRKSSSTWGPEAWKKIVVCIVSDGRSKINPRTQAVLAGMGVFQDGIMKQEVNKKPVTAHIFEYTTQVGVEVKGEQVRLVTPGATPVQILFCLKEKNQKKINSHRWFFNAFGRVLDPKICVLIDAGTKPGKSSIYDLWKAFDREPHCAGACGEIKALLDGGKNLINPLVATQNFEYKMSNILDKPLESAFGFISVLPGAFSAYRYVALQNDARGNGPLQKYFLGETLHGPGADTSIFISNMYLAEDRILCFELVSKRNCSWLLRYVKSATGETDVPTTISELILQRRRWLNGSFFAAVYSLVHFFQIWRSDHNIIRILALHVEALYNTINMLFAWFAIGNFFLVFRILTQSLSQPQLLGDVGLYLGLAFQWIYLCVLVTCFVLSLGNTPQGSRKFYTSMVIFWAFIMAYLMFASIFISVRAVQSELATRSFNVANIFSNSVFSTLVVSLASTYVLYFVISFLFFEPWHMFTSFIQYLLLTPTYINVLNVYAFCNTHDISWGTKGDTGAEKLDSVSTSTSGKVEVNIPSDEKDLNAMYEAELRKFATKEVVTKKAPTPAKLQEKHENYYKGVRSGVVLFWMFCNFALCAVVLSTGGLEKIKVGDPNKQEERQNQTVTIYLKVILWSVAGLSLFRFVGAIWFLIVRMFRGI